MMKNISLTLVLCVTLTACAAPKVVTGNSRSVVIDDGQYIGTEGGLITGGIENNTAAGAKAEADKWCAKYGRVSGAEIPHYPQTRRREYECVSK